MLVMTVVSLAAVAIFASGWQSARSSLRRAEHLAFHDPLTQLPNRLLFADRAAMTFSLARKKEQRAAVLFIDLDGFKKINDTYGHRSGDCVLQMVGIRLRACLRDIDTVARIGGDEFAVLLGPLDDRHRAETVAAAITEAMRRSFPLGEAAAGVAASIGISMFPEDGHDVESLLQHADAEMYQAKEGGRDDVASIISYGAMARTHASGSDRQQRLEAFDAVQQVLTQGLPVLGESSGSVRGRAITTEMPGRDVVLPPESLTVAIGQIARAGHD